MIFDSFNWINWRKTMVPKHKTLIFGAMLGVSALAFSGAGLAGAAAFQPSPSGWADATATSDGFIQVADRRHNMEWNRERDGDRCSHRRGDCRHFHRGYYYTTPWWTLPLVIGNQGYDYYDDDGYDGLNSQHVEWCMDHYRSYNPRTNTWVSFSGMVHECDSPYA
jgi:hypothetical protein